MSYKDSTEEANFGIFIRKKCCRPCISRFYLWSPEEFKKKTTKNICYLNINPLCSWLMQNGVGCTQKHGTPNHFYAGGRQLFVTDYPKQHAPSPLRGGRSYFSRSRTGGAVCCFTERARVSVLGLWVCMKNVCLFTRVYVGSFVLFFSTSPCGVSERTCKDNRTVMTWNHKVSDWMNNWHSLPQADPGRFEKLS